MLAQDFVRVVERIHLLAAQLPHHDWRFDEREIPASGVYLMFERGEEIETPSGGVPRIVRVGSHRKAGRLVDRIRANFSNPYSGSHPQQPPLRLHYRAALLRSQGKDPADQGFADLRFEERVTTRIRDHFTFTAIAMQDADERLEMERAIVAALAQYPPRAPSRHWVGRFAEPPIAKSGVWNLKHLASRPLDIGQLARLERHAGSATAEGGEQPSRAESGDMFARAGGPGASSAGSEAAIDAAESRRIAESLFLGGLIWLRATYSDHDFVTRRDIVWMLQKRLRTVARRTLSGFEVHSAVRDPERRGRPFDLAITNSAGRLLFVANVLYEPDRLRGRQDLRYAALPYTSWDEVTHECARARRMVAQGLAEAASTVLVDEGGRYDGHGLPAATRERWAVADFPSLTVTYAAERAR